MKNNTNTSVCEYTGDEDLILDLTHLFLSLGQDSRLEGVKVFIVEGIDSHGLLKGEYNITSLFKLLASNAKKSGLSEEEGMLNDPSYSQKAILEELFVTINNIVDAEPMVDSFITIKRNKAMLVKGRYDLYTFIQYLAFAVEDAFYRIYDCMIADE